MPESYHRTNRWCGSDPGGILPSADLQTRPAQARGIAHNPRPFAEAEVEGPCSARNADDRCHAVQLRLRQGEVPDLRHGCQVGKRRQGRTLFTRHSATRSWLRRAGRVGQDRGHREAQHQDRKDGSPIGTSEGGGCHLAIRALEVVPHSPSIVPDRLG